MALVLSDALTRMLLKTRPYETKPGAADAAYDQTLAEFERALAVPGMSARKRRGVLVGCVAAMRDRFRAVPAAYAAGKPLIGLVGEIFCRQNDFSNDAIARRVERLGGECWISDIAEWVWYTNWNQANALRKAAGRINLPLLKAELKSMTQRRYEHALLAPLHDDLVGYEEPADVRDVLSRSRPYLPAEGCLGEMVLSVGKAIYLAEKGAAGIIDISPFTCMNGVICEAVYPAVSAELGDIPIKVCYFDGVNTTLDRDLEIFLDLARAYQQRSKWARTYPRWFAR
jgi:predicted nucleotide-binding protein (sugar kinase/HSP70/actin superfamily)